MPNQQPIDTRVSDVEKDKEIVKLRIDTNLEGGAVALRGGERNDKAAQHNPKKAIKFVQNTIPGPPGNYQHTTHNTD